MKKPKPQTERESTVPRSFRRLCATIRIPSIAEERELVAAANECADLLQEKTPRGH